MKKYEAILILDDRKVEGNGSAFVKDVESVIAELGGADVEVRLVQQLSRPDLQLDDTNSTEDTPVAVDAGLTSDESVEDVEVEIELDLDLADMGDLELEFEDEIVEEASEGAVLADVPVGAEEDEGLSSETRVLSFDEEGPEGVF